MTSKDLLKAIGGVSDEMVLKAGKDRQKIKRSVLIAAAAAAALLLVGCTAVYLLHVKDMQLGQETVVIPDFGQTVIQHTEEDGEPRKTTIVDGEYQGEKEVTQHVFSANSWKGTPEYQAAQEWFQFKNSFDPNHEIANAYAEKVQEKLETDPNFVSFFPKKYWYYDVYDQNMADEVDRIAEKYRLQLITEWKCQPYEFQEKADDRLKKFTGVESFLRPGLEIDGIVSSQITKENRFSMVFFLNMPTMDTSLLTSFEYTPRNLFDVRSFTLGEHEQWQEVNYTTTSGDKVLLLYSMDGGFSWIFCQRSDAMLSLRVESRMDVNYDDRVECTFMTLDQLKEIADAFDFTVQLNPDWEYVEQENQAYQEKVGQMRKQQKVQSTSISEDDSKMPA